MNLDRPIANFAFGFFSALVTLNIMGLSASALLGALLNALIVGGYAFACQLKEETDGDGNATVALALLF